MSTRVVATISLGVGLAAVAGAASGVTFALYQGSFGAFADAWHSRCDYARPAAPYDHSDGERARYFIAAQGYVDCVNNQAKHDAMAVADAIGEGQQQDIDGIKQRASDDWSAPFPGDHRR